MSQTSYNLVPPVGVEGLVADMQEGTIILPRMASGLVPVGKLCAPGANQLLGPPVAADPMASSAFVGIPIYDATRAPYDATLGYSCYADKDHVPVLYKGPIYVVPEAGSAPVDQGDVYVRVAASGSNTILGTFSSAAGTGKVLLTQAKWASGFMQSNIAILQLR